MKIKLSESAVLKIVSFAIAIVLWSYVAVVIDPPVETNIKNVKVNLLGEEALAKSNLGVIGKSDIEVDLRVKGNRFVSADLKPESIVANVDLSQITDSGIHKLPINVKFSTDGITIVKKNPLGVELSIDKLSEKRLNVQLETDGTLDAQYVHYDTKITPSSILISGSQRYIEQLTRAVVIIDYTNVNSDIIGNFKVKFYDKEKEIKSNLVIPETTEVNVRCKIGKIKTVGFALNIKGLGSPSQNVYAMSPEAITIYGEPKTIDKITKIYTEAITFKPDEEEVRAKLIIPDGVYIRDDIKDIAVKTKTLKKAN